MQVRRPVKYISRQLYYILVLSIITNYIVLMLYTPLSNSL